MKMIKLYNVLTLITLVSMLITSCVNDTDFDIPQEVLNPIAPNFLTETDNQGNLVFNEITFNAVKSALAQGQANGDNFVTFEADQYIIGYVISSDDAGNFFEELIIQNDIDGENPEEDPRLGIQLEINVSSLSQTYEFGRKVYVLLNGLSVGLSNREEGVLVLGKENGGAVGQIQSFELTDFVIRSNEVVALQPKIISLASINEDDINTYVQVTSAQFNRNNIGLTFAGEQADEFDGERRLESCIDEGAILFETSTFSDFKSLPLRYYYFI